MNLNPFKHGPSAKDRRSIETALGMARQKLDQLEAGVKLASYEAADPDDQDAQTRLSDAKAARSVTKTRILDLEGALSVAVEREQQANQEKLAEERKAKATAVLELLAQRDDAGRRMQEHLEQAQFAWLDLIAATEATLAAAGSVQLPAQGAVGLGYLRQFLAVELWRVAGDAEIGAAKAWPGVRAPSWGSVNDPKSLADLSSNLHEATQQVRLHLGGGEKSND